jgi:hypothetical protein
VADLLQPPAPLAAAQEPHPPGGLHGLLAKIRDLGLPLLAVRRLDPD